MFSCYLTKALDTNLVTYALLKRKDINVLVILQTQTLSNF